MSGPVSCDLCGETWDTDPRLSVPCPQCSAPAGRNCRRPSGHPVMGTVHIPREQAAVDAGLMSVYCSGAKTPTKKPEGAKQERLL